MDLSDIQKTYDSFHKEFETRDPNMLSAFYLYLLVVGMEELIQEVKAIRDQVA